MGDCSWLRSSAQLIMVAMVTITLFASTRLGNPELCSAALLRRPRKPGVQGPADTFTSAYLAAAHANWTEWRSSLFLRNAELQRSTEKMLNKPAQPAGHKRFDLFSPFISCPNDEPLARIGGEGDGEAQRVAQQPA